MTGTLKLPTEKKSTEFSKTNWGDHTLATPCSKKVIKCASVFLTKMSSLKEQQWDDIFEKALVFQVTLGKQRMAKEDEIKRLLVEVLQFLGYVPVGPTAPDEQYRQRHRERPAQLHDSNDTTKEHSWPIWPRHYDNME
jgi:hypothetical protein